jgi:hypothetical protein
MEFPVGREEMRSVSKWCLIVLALSMVAGCSGDSTSPGKVKIDSTDVFKHNKAMKSKPPQKPAG